MSALAFPAPHDFPGKAVPLQLAKRKPNKGGKILVIDDDQILCLGLEVRLRANCYDACFAHDANFAIRAALSEMPKLIILDIVLPDCDGYFVMESLKQFSQLADVPVIVLTGRDAFTHERRCHNAGAKRFFEKPVDIRDLLTAIEQLM